MTRLTRCTARAAQCLALHGTCRAPDREYARALGRGERWRCEREGDGGAEAEDHGCARRAHGTCRAVPGTDWHVPCTFSETEKNQGFFATRNPMSMPENAGVLKPR